MVDRHKLTVFYLKSIVRDSVQFEVFIKINLSFPGFWAQDRLIYGLMFLRLKYKLTKDYNWEKTEVKLNFISVLICENIQ